MNDMCDIKIVEPISECQRGCCGGTGNCSTYHCYKGGPEEPPAGLETSGCPLYSHPAQLTDNRNCVLCMECDKVPSLHHATCRVRCIWVCAVFRLWFPMLPVALPESPLCTLPLR